MLQKKLDRTQRGTRKRVRIEGDDRWLEAVYLGPASDAEDRPDRRMFAVDDGESWKLVMSRNIAEMKLPVSFKTKVSRTVACPWAGCKAPPGGVCLGETGPITTVHWPRKKAAWKVVVDSTACPSCHAKAGEDCRTRGGHRVRWEAHYNQMETR